MNLPHGLCPVLFLEWTVFTQNSHTCCIKVLNLISLFDNDPNNCESSVFSKTLFAS